LRTCTRWSRRFNLASVASSHEASVRPFLIAVGFFDVAGGSMDGGTKTLRPCSRGPLGGGDRFWLCWAIGVVVLCRKAREIPSISCRQRRKPHDLITIRGPVLVLSMSGFGERQRSTGSCRGVVGSVPRATV
jgi:hypothetical protein